MTKWINRKLRFYSCLKVIIVIIFILLLVKAVFYKKQTDSVIENNTIESTAVETNEIPSGLTLDDENSLESESFQELSDELLSGFKYDNAFEDNTFIVGQSNNTSIYYSQTDSRWKSHPYTITNNPNQTIGSSGCGPTSAAMVVSSLVGTVTPDQMGDLYVQHGHRTINSGTYYSAFPWTATYFNLKYSRVYSVDDMIALLNDGYYVIISCSSGLFTSGGHFIVAYGVENDNIKIYDPYLYSGKFETSPRKGKVNLTGNTVYCSINNFKSYANSKAYFGFKSDNDSNTNTTTTTEPTEYTMYVSTNSGNLRVRSSNSTNSNILSTLIKGSEVKVVETLNGWSKISSPIPGWVCNSYLSSTKPTSTTTIKQSNTVKYTIGKYKVTGVSKNSHLNVRFGASTSYSAKTWKQLSSNARLQNGNLGNKYCNGYMKGVVCTVTKVNGEWGKTSSGWINLRYCTKL